MITVLVWVLVYGTNVNSGGLVNVVGDFASLEDCERVARAVTTLKTWGYAKAQCVQVNKVVQK